MTCRFVTAMPALATKKQVPLTTVASGWGAAAGGAAGGEVGCPAASVLGWGAQLSRSPRVQARFR